MRHLDAVRAELAVGSLSKRAAARRLRVSVATLDQLVGVQKREPAQATVVHLARRPRRAVQ